MGLVKLKGQEKILLDDWLINFVRNRSKAEVKSLLEDTARSIRRDFHKEIKTVIEQMIAALPFKDGDTVDLQFNTHEQIRKSAAVIQDNGKLMDLKELLAKFELEEE